MKFSSNLLAAALAAAPFIANAHMILKQPKPFGIPTKDPLLESGANFPCKGVSYVADARTQWPAGSSQILETEGTAVHGGGSCQIAVTTDKSPTATSKWKVIYSIEGGCPASPKNGGNMESGDVLPTFNFTIPSEVPNGDHVAAWTWVNRVGNREMYMTCSAVTVTGGAKDNSEFDKLPDMAVANIGGPGNPKNCKTTAGFDYTFGTPGKYLLKAGKGPFQPLCGSATSDGNVSPGSAPAPAPAPAPQQPSAAPPTPSAPASAPIQTSTLRTLITITASSTPKPTLSTDSTGNTNPPPASAPAPAPAPSAPVPAPPAPAPASGSSSVTGTCTTDGSIVCNGPDKFAICNFGKAVWQSVAQGTTCKDGKIAKRDGPAGLATLIRGVRWTR